MERIIENIIYTSNEIISTKYMNVIYTGMNNNMNNGMKDSI